RYYLTIEKLYTLSLFLAPLGDIKIKQCPPIHSLRERVGSTDGCCRRLKARSTSTQEFFLRKTKTSIVALEIYILV
ncbi:hypothetical protein, partial [Enterobacter pseudoroggenkampii]|uniref:hypothetical protein n=1 Tax=Enterobacter pseudoroggenkampii TaxID=2996112 RepID=UPI0038AEE4A3